MLPEKNALPRAQGAATVLYRQRQVRLRQHAANVGRHVVFSFRGVREERIAVSHLPRHERLQVRHDAGIGVLTNHQRCAGMTNENMAKTGIDPRVGYRPLYVRADVVCAPAAGPDLQFLLRDHGR